MSAKTAKTKAAKNWNADHKKKDSLAIGSFLVEK
jgi:hypothetical protein